MRPREQHRGKISLGSSLGFTGKKSYGCYNHTGPVVGCDWVIKPSEAPIGILRPYCCRGHIRLCACYGLIRLCTDGLIEKLACDNRAGVVRALHEYIQCFSYQTWPIRDPCGTRKGAVWYPCEHIQELTQPEFAKIPYGRRAWQSRARTGP